MLPSSSSTASVASYSDASSKNLADTNEESLPPSPNETDRDHHTNNGGISAATPPPDPSDALHEIYWYILQDRGNLAAGELTVGQVIACLDEEGLWFWRDDRFRECQNVALSFVGAQRSKFSCKIAVADQQLAEQTPLDFDTFSQFVTPHASLFLKALSEELVIPDWSTFGADMTYHFSTVETNQEGETAQYIPILQRANPEQWALSICSIDGQRLSIGDTDATFSIQSVSKPVTYALCLEKEGEEAVDEWIGVEPAGRAFNTQDLDADTNRPFNASVNSGAIMAAGLFTSNFPAETTWIEVVDRIRQTWHDLCGNDLEIGFSQETFESEKSTAYNNYAIAYNLKGRKGLPRNVDLQKMLDVYLGCCSIEMSTEALAVAAATLANGGVCPITQREVFPALVVRHVLSELMLCGMYDQAGHFAVQVGVPAKSGVSGVLMVMVPNVMGFVTFSPRLNKNGNSVRGIEFCKRLVSSYRVHTFEPLRSGNAGAKVDPRHNGWKEEQSLLSRMAWALQVGDTWAIRLRDIFLFAMIQAACSSREGMSSRMKNTIRHHYNLMYQIPVDEDMLGEVIETVKSNPSDMRILESLTVSHAIPDSFRNVLLMAVIELMMNDGQIDETEKNTAVRIAVLLGIDRHVALMEMNRFEQHVGHRFKDVDPCDCIDNLSSSRHRAVDLDHIRNQILNISEEILDKTDSNHRKKHRNGVRQLSEAVASGNDKGEALLLRREVLRLQRQVDKLTCMLHDERRRSHSRSLSDPFVKGS
jgi:glutaminase